jgi:hypothetical protein
VAVDVVIVVAFAVTAALDPDNILGQKDMDVPDVQGLLPTATVLTLRVVVLAAERYLLPVARGGVVLGGRIASLVGCYYAGRWLYENSDSDWQDAFLGGGLGYAFAGVAGIGFGALVHGLVRATSGRHDQRAAERPAAGHPTPVPGPTESKPTDTAPANAAAPRREIARESLFGLVGVFVGVTGLIASVTDLARIALAAVVGAAVAVAIGYATRRRSAPPR